MSTRTADEGVLSAGGALSAGDAGRLSTSTTGDALLAGHSLDPLLAGEALLADEPSAPTAGDAGEGGEDTAGEGGSTTTTAIAAGWEAVEEEGLVSEVSDPGFFRGFLFLHRLHLRMKICDGFFPFGSMFEASEIYPFA